MSNFIRHKIRLKNVWKTKNLHFMSNFIRHKIRLKKCVEDICRF